MKKLLLIVLFVATAMVGCAQKITRPDTAKYERYYKIPAETTKQINLMLSEYKRLIIYDTTLTPEERVAKYQRVEEYLKEKSPAIRLDSVKISK